MRLQDELDALRAEFLRSAPPGRDVLYDAKAEELRRVSPIEKALKTGDHAPDFTLYLRRGSWPNQQRQLQAIWLTPRAGGSDC